MSEGAYLIKYDVGNPNVSFKTSNGVIDIRSGGQQAIAELPIPREMLEAIPGITVVDIPSLNAADTNKVPHPKSKQWEEQAKKAAKRRRR